MPYEWDSVIRGTKIAAKHIYTDGSYQYDLYTRIRDAEDLVNYEINGQHGHQQWNFNYEILKDRIKKIDDTHFTDLQNKITNIQAQNYCRTHNSTQYVQHRNDDDSGDYSTHDSSECPSKFAAHKVGHFASHKGSYCPSFFQSKYLALDHTVKTTEKSGNLGSHKAGYDSAHQNGFYAGYDAFQYVTQDNTVHRTKFTTDNSTKYISDNPSHNPAHLGGFDNGYKSGHFDPHRNGEDIVDNEPHYVMYYNTVLSNELGTDFVNHYNGQKNTQNSGYYSGDLVGEHSDHNATYDFQHHSQKKFADHSERDIVHRVAVYGTDKSSDYGTHNDYRYDSYQLSDLNGYRSTNYSGDNPSNFVQIV